jgi:hypothetical protein
MINKNSKNSFEKYIKIFTYVDAENDDLWFNCCGLST